MKEINPFRKTLIVLGVLLLIITLTACTVKYKPTVVSKEHYDMLLVIKKDICILDIEDDAYIRYNYVIDRLVDSTKNMDLYIQGYLNDYEYVYEIPPNIKQRLLEDYENLYCNNE